MQLIRGLQNFPASNGCVATIGNFDGVHRGHRAIFARLAEVGKQQNLPLCAVTFEPLPHEFFRPDDCVVRLNTLRDKSRAIADCGINQLLIMRFNRQLAGLQAEEFIDDALLSTLKVKHLVVGDDFRFGNQRRGDFAMLQAAGEQHGFGVESFNTVVSNAIAPAAAAGSSANSRISSSAIRTALADHDFNQAELLIGHPYSISGRVIKGQQLARQLGYPTANVCLKDFRPGIRGVFAVTLTRNNGSANTPFQGVANLGERPTVDGKRLLLEVHVFDAEPELYGEVVTVGFHHFLRGEKKFDGLDQLKQAIANDAASARAFFAAR